MIMRFLNPQGIAGVAASLCLAILLIVQKADSLHWKQEASRIEQLYRTGQATSAATIANYRAAAEAARAADLAAAQRVAAEQSAINERTTNDLESRLAAVRTRAEQLRFETGGAAADPGIGRGAPVPSLPPAARGAGQTAGDTGLSLEQRLTATEQAIQLDELIKWVRAQSEVDPNALPAGRIDSQQP